MLRSLGDAVAATPSPSRAACTWEEAGGPPARGDSGLVRSGSNHGNCFFFFSIPPFADDSGDEEPASQSDKSELHGTLKTLSSKLEDLSTCNDLIAKHGAALQRSLSELENLKLPAESGEKIKAVNERATLFRITSNAMINVSAAGRATAFVRGGRGRNVFILLFLHRPFSPPARPRFLPVRRLSAEAVHWHGARAWPGARCWLSAAVRGWEVGKVQPKKQTCVTP